MSDFLITRKLKIPSLTLNQKGLNTFKSILEKTGHSPTFSIETADEEINFVDFKSFIDQNWPAHIKQFTFKTHYTGRRIHGYIDLNNIFGLSNITIEDNDRDWLSARVDELRRFFDQNRNFHFLFNDIRYVLAQALLFFGLLDYWIIRYLVEQDLKSPIFFVLVLSYFSAWYLYGSLLPKVFPFLVLSPEHPSFTTKLRIVLKYIIPTIFIALSAQFIWSLIPI